MSTSSEMEELPYVVWYQCRMCTHIFLDDVEKMFAHFEKRHGAMIDCDELRDIVYKNGLNMGGLPCSPEVKLDTEEDAEHDATEEDPVHFLPRPRYIENDNGFGENEMVLASDGADDNDNVNGNYASHNGDFDEDAYEDGEHQNTESLELRYNYDDEEQLPEDDPELKLNGFMYEDDNEAGIEEGACIQVLREDGDDDGEGDDTQMDGCNNTSSYAEDEDNEGDYYYEDDEREEGEIIGTAEQSFNDEDLMDEEEERIYGDDDEDEQVSDETETLPNINGNKNGNGVQNIANDQNLLNGFGYSCKFCGKFFTTRRGVETHEQRHKSPPASNNSSTSRRSNERKLYPCKLCKRRSFPTFKELKAHVKSHTEERIHICRFCCLTFSNTASLTKHLTIHKRENPNKCFCGKTFVSANTLKIHKKIHTGIKPFVCNFHQCGRAFVTKSTLESHLRTHTGEKPYQCGYCPSSFTTSSAKYRHERHVHKVSHPGAE